MRFSLGSVLIFSLALASAVLVIILPSREPEGIPFWTFNTEYRDAYTVPVAKWNTTHPESRFAMMLLHAKAIEQRMLSGFLTGAPVADLLETHEMMYPQVYLGSIDHIGFLDITERVHAEGLYEHFGAVLDKVNG